jgi:hypothetical protein
MLELRFVLAGVSTTGRPLEEELVFAEGEGTDANGSSGSIVSSNGPGLVFILQVVTVTTCANAYY